MRMLLLVLLFIGAGSAGAAERPANFVLHNEARAVPDVRFVDGQGHALTLADFKGKVVLLNVWATWCPPCRKEMPALDHLQATLGGSDFEVVALSVDRAGVEPVRRFYGETGVSQIKVYLDASGKALRTLDAVGLPTTLLLNPEGREVGRLVGPAVWDSPEMVAFLRERIGLLKGGTAMKSVPSNAAGDKPGLGRHDHVTGGAAPANLGVIAHDHE